jgi:hypothetical protein
VAKVPDYQTINRNKQLYSIFKINLDGVTKRTRNKCIRSAEIHFSFGQFTPEEYVSMDATYVYHQYDTYLAEFHKKRKIYTSSVADK